VDSYTLLKLFGILALIFLVIGFCLGIFNIKIKNKLLFHKIFAGFGLLFGLIHFLFVLLS